MEASSSRTPKQHIEEIRRTKFSIGGEPNPLTPDLHQAVKNLSAELYAKDVHFLMELIQNAEDNVYLPGVEPSLEFIITSKDITATGAASTLLIFNNEKGFSEKNIESICSVGRSTKKGNRQHGYIGEKGIGFKSVFLIASKPYIFSNGYQIRFNEDPQQDCDVGYIVPEWVENPTASDIQQIYGSDKILPATTLILPLKSEKVGAVKQQLSSIHPEVLLFLSKIKRLRIKEDNDDPQHNTVSAVSISSEINFTTRKNIDAESYTLHLSAEEDCNKVENVCTYYMWRQKFPVKLENRVERRMEVEEWVITLAFPFGERLDRGLRLPGIYAFLPTEMVTNFPFIIQADFVLASSRETILLDNIWNKGILDCVASAFIKAFISLVKEKESAPTFSLPPMFEFLPIKSSSYKELNNVRAAIKGMVVSENLIPCESYTQQKLFCRPGEVGRLVPTFWNILMEARKQGVCLQNLSSHGRYVLSSTFDEAKYDHILDFLGVGPVDMEWYVKCIKASNLVMGISEDLYIKLLLFFTDNWSSFNSTDARNILLLKYVDCDGKVSLWSIYGATKYNGGRICFSSNADHISWLINWNNEFRCSASRFFMPKDTQEALRSSPRRESVQEWLRQHANVVGLTVLDFGHLLANAVKTDRRLVLAFTHFLYHSLLRKYMSSQDAYDLCNSAPLIDNYGQVITQWRGVLVPANGSDWVRLLGSNPWKRENYVELGEDYIREGNFAGVNSAKKQVMWLMKAYIGASDVPDLCPPDAAFATVSSPLTKENTFLLLDWIRKLKCKGTQIPIRFLQCIKKGSWLKTSVGFKAPSESFLSSEDWGSLLQMGSVLVDIPLIDQEFYENRISSYREELKTIGVMFEFGEACRFIGERLKNIAASTGLTRANVFSLLQLIKFMQEHFMPPKELIKSIREGCWLQTLHGKKSPVGSILFSPEWKAALQISNLPFINADYYGQDILSYKAELELLGVIVGFKDNYKIVVDHLRLPSSPSSLTADSVILILECIRNVRPFDEIIRKLKDQKWVRTNFGFCLPSVSFLFDSKWEGLLKTVNGMPLMDEGFYGNRIRSYEAELAKIGVVTTLQEASKVIARRFKELASKSSVSKENTLSLLAYYRKLKQENGRFPAELFNCMLQEKWLRSRLGDYRSPEDSILFDAEWESISQICILPFIDDRDTYYGKDIYEYRNELKDLGAVVEFKEGWRFVANGVSIFDPSKVAAVSVLSLLKCIRNCQEHVTNLPENFMKRINKKWLKTHAGYRCPSECILFDSEWSRFLERQDGPFIDEAFYGTEIASYRKELQTLGVIVEVEKGCSLVASHLSSHSQSAVITRIYEYLMKFHWAPDCNEASWIWIPNGSDQGEWVGPKSCVIHDKDNLFRLRLKVLDMHYKKELHGLFSVTLGVRSNPAIEDYCKLWNDWENSVIDITYRECCAFWAFAVKHHNSKFLSSSISKLPVKASSDGVKLVDKRDVFIPDDLQLKDLFEKSSQESLIIWYPQRSFPSISRSKLNQIYSNIGVRTISESIRKSESFLTSQFEFDKLEPKDAMLRNGLFRIALGFLADPSFEMPMEKRHQIVRSIIDVEVYRSDEPITLSYDLPLSSGEVIKAKATRMIRWDREDSKLFVQTINLSSSQRSKIEFAMHFSEVISKGLLWEEPEQIAVFGELIKVGCLLEFEDEAIDLLLKANNLEVLLEDEEFLSSAFSSK